MTPKSVETLLKEKKVYEIPKGDPIFASPDISVQKAIEIMQEQHHGYIVLTEEKKVVGIFTETDVCRKLLGEKVDWNAPVSQFMTKEPIVIKPKDSVGRAIATMGDCRIYHLPIVDDHGKLQEVLSVRTLIRFLAEFYPTEIYNLPPDPNKIVESAEGG